MPATTKTRQRNPRGQGERLRDDIIDAASRLLADPAAPPLTLRAVAREVGVAATSVYLHFDSIDSLTLAVVNHLFDELLRREDEITETDPRQRVLAGAVVYCEFGVANPGHYQLMFATPLPLPEFTPGHFPGRKALQQLTSRVAECICCQMSWAVKTASGASGLTPMHSATRLVSCCNAFRPGKCPGVNSGSGSGVANIS